MCENVEGIAVPKLVSMFSQMLISLTTVIKHGPIKKYDATSFFPHPTSHVQIEYPIFRASFH